MKRILVTRKLFFLVLLLPLFAVAFLRLPVHAAPVYQLTPFPTPTPGPDGRIIYIVQPNDTLLRISLIAGISVDELRGLNNIVGENIIVGQELLLGLGGPSQVTPTPGPSPTPTIVVPTPTTQPGSGTLCILLYYDENGDSIRQEDEPSIAGSAISITGQASQVSLTETTESGLEPQCFEDLPQDRYTISVAVPTGYNPTTPSSYILELNAGDTSYLDFGAQPNSQTQVDAPEQPVERSRSPIFGIIGAALLLVGAALALFAGRYLRR